MLSVLLFVLHRADAARKFSWYPYLEKASMRLGFEISSLAYFAKVFISFKRHLLTLGNDFEEAGHTKTDLSIL
jgi:hypothetical protein